MIDLKNLKNTFTNYQKLKLSKIPKEQIMMVRHAVNLQDLENIITNYPQYDWLLIKQEIEKGRKQISDFNKSGNKIEVYKTKGYSNIKLEKMDSQNFVGHLMIISPTIRHSKKFGRIFNKSIEIIKKELQLVDEEGKNYLLRYYNEFHHSDLEFIIEALNIYEEQIERQYELINDTNVNLLKENFLNKKDLVLEKYKLIVDYLIVNNNHDLFWELLTDDKRKIYLESVKKYNNKVKDKLANYIAHYTTLPELEQLDKENIKVLDRFIR